MGDIRNAKVTFVKRNTGAAIATVDVMVNSADTSAGTASYIWTVNIGSSFTQTFTIGTVVSGYYLRNSPADDVVITVLKGKPGKKK